jgi:Uma2 family endonuclease
VSTVIVNASWDTYTRLLLERGHQHSARLSYGDGQLEISTIQPRREWIKRLIERIIDTVAEAARIHVAPIGMTTLKRADLFKGAEPDSAYYIRPPRGRRMQPELDLLVDPPPDLIVEVDITSDSMPKASLYAALGIREWWKFEGAALRILTLGPDGYRQQDSSPLLPPVTARAIESFLATAEEMESFEWTASIRDWVRSALL